MSKPESGLFDGTAGIDDFYGDAEKVIASRVEGLDLTLHPIQQKQLSAKQRARIRSKINSRTATREEYMRYQWDKRFTRRKKEGIHNFWKEEKSRIEQGEPCTRDWDEKQVNDILNRRNPKFKAEPMEAHHSYSAKDYPQLANSGLVIYPATHNEHLKGWHGGNYRKSKPGRRIRRTREF